MFSWYFWTPKTNHKILRNFQQKSRAYIWRRNLVNLPTTNAQRQTIYALSTPPGKGGVAIVRVSGPDALTVWKRMVRSHHPTKPICDPTPWRMQRCRIVNPENESLIDDGLGVYFKGWNLYILKPVFPLFNSIYSTAPYSYTTRPTIELHIHSGRALISALLSSLSSLPNLRLAEPGEFTRQAFLGGRLDLTQVEGLHDLIEADTEVQRVWALGGAGVSFQRIYNAPFCLNFVFS